ncbi:MAG TPA: arsenite methyltransferase [Rubricoccaceae bacterium]|nr:arsenite methyltransferase [Rubricoccaceae bacterium]
MSTLLPSPDLAADPSAIKAQVREKYARVVTQGESCCAPSCCSADTAADELSMIGDAYTGVEGYVAEADLGLGCGLPTEHAGLREGQTVLDLGSGAGVDAFVARREVGPSGRVIGVDFTPEMVAKARQNAARLGFDNVTFVEGEIEALPLGDATVDVALSNCVLNLVPDKARAFAEVYRVLRPGGHFCISDVVARGALPEAVRRSAALYAGCVAGALEEADYLAVIRAAGFEGVEVVKARRIAVPASALPPALTAEERAAFEAGGVWSVTVRGTRPEA